MNEWQDIETAPKDGRQIQVAWISGGQLQHGPKQTYWDGKMWNGCYTPTHWMPLPEPPR